MPPRSRKPPTSPLSNACQIRLTREGVHGGRTGGGRRPAFAGKFDNIAVRPHIKRARSGVQCVSVPISVPSRFVPPMSMHTMESQPDPSPSTTATIKYTNIYSALDMYVHTFAMFFEQVKTRFLIGPKTLPYGFSAFLSPPPFRHALSVECQWSSNQIRHQQKQQLQIHARVAPKLVTGHLPAMHPLQDGPADIAATAAAAARQGTELASGHLHHDPLAQRGRRPGVHGGSPGDTATHQLYVQGVLQVANNTVSR